MIYTFQGALVCAAAASGDRNGGFAPLPKIYLDTGGSPTSVTWLEK